MKPTQVDLRLMQPSLRPNRRIYSDINHVETFDPFSRIVSSEQGDGA